MIDLLVSASAYSQNWLMMEDDCDQNPYEALQKKWDDIFEKELSLFVRQDAKLFLQNTKFVFFLISIAAKEADLITTLRRVNYEGVIEELNQHYNLDLTSDTPFEVIRSQIQDILIEKSDEVTEDTLQIFMEILKSPQEIMTRIANALQTLYPLFKDRFFTDQSYQDIDAEIAVCNQQLLETPEEFIRQITLVNYSDQTKVLDNFKYYILYVTSESVLFLHSHRILLFGVSIRGQIEKEARRVDLQAFIKLISDPTRYDILKLLNKQKWYGNELAKHFNLTPATISHHLNKFITLRLIRAESGPQNKIYFDLDQEELRRILKDIERDLLS
jgi:DNA-binding transcriptional ArsR family regulator